MSQIKKLLNHGIRGTHGIRKILPCILCIPWLILVAEARQPNVLFIVVDDLGWKDTGCYGSTFYETPNVDRLAATGMRFTDAYSANPLCSPTRSSILSGQYPVRTGFTSASGHIPGDHKHAESHNGAPDQRGAGPSSVNHLPLEYYTLGEAFKDAGYATAFLGKWHMGYDPYIPENNGFDFVVGGREHPGPPGMDGNRKFFPPWDKKKTLPENPPANLHIDDYLGDCAVEYIAANKEKPFMMCFWLYDVHAPFQSKPEYVEQWKKKADPANPQHSPTMAAMIQVMDENVGRVLDALEANGLADDTIVIFTSDNGGNMYDVADGTTPTNNEPLRSGKGNNYEGGVRIPLIVSWPGKIKPGSVNPAVISTVDHYPSLLEMTGQKLRPDDHKDGVSYVPALKGKDFDRGPTVCDFSHFVPATMNIPNTWIRSGDWKLLRFWFDGAGQEHRYELYNLKDDIGETKNLASAYPEKVQTMAAQLDGYYKKSGALKPNANKAYNGRTVGVWFSTTGKGSLTAKDGALVMRAEEKQFDAQTRVTPSLVESAWVEFEARSAKGNIVSVQWTSHATPDFGSAERNVAKPLSNDWKTFRVKMDFQSRIKDVRFVLSNEGDEVELRNVNLLTPDQSVITEYKFY
ncbi:sulfatase [Pontiellaceae bacterium B12227]|nr:sulfatase [Pontiellaceae bacterium B12227]